MQEFIAQHSDPDLPSDLDLTNVKLTLAQLLLSQGEVS